MRTRLVAGAVAVTVLLAVMGGCVVRSGQLDREQEALIDRTAEGVLAAMGGSEQFFAFEYTRRTSSCLSDEGVEPGLGEGEAWYARKAYDLLARDEPYDYAAMVESARDHYRELGWDVQLYRYAVDRLSLVAIRDDVGVLITTPPTQLTISTGPCGPALSGPSDDWVPVPDVDATG